MNLSPVYYEVNIEVQKDIYEEYMAWLQAHIQKMLAIPGFEKADLSEKNARGKYQLVVLYQLASKDHLDQYFENHAPLMRQEAFTRFGEKVKIERRILEA